MNSNEFKKSGTGKIIRALDGHDAFVPYPLPPKLELTWELANAISMADRSLSELSGAASKLPNPHLLIIPFTRKEAVLSSKIEGTIASLSDLLSFEALGLSPEDKQEDVKEVANYVTAMNHGLDRLKKIPVSQRLIKEMHHHLLHGVRGDSLMPGEFRNRQNWIGPPRTKIEDSVYVPPPVVEMQTLLDDLEKYIHADSQVPPLVKMGVIHYQFEAIHPFLDGNGRIGRLLITLLLVANGLLPQPLLYLSAFFDKHKEEYYDLLLAVSQKGDWDSWLKYFLQAIAEQAKDALARSSELLDLNQSYRKKVQRKRTSAHLLSLLDHLFSMPVITTKNVSTFLEVTPKSAQKHIDRLIDENILKEITGKQRNRMYFATEILRIVNI